MIYLVGSNLEFDGVKTLILNEIKFCKFNVDLANFHALVLTSKNAINALEFNQIPPDKNLQIYAIGDASAKAAHEFGFSQIYTAKNSHADEFVNEIVPFLKGKKALFLHASKTASNTNEILRQNGVNLSEIIAYENEFKPVSSDLKPPKNSVIIFTAPSAVRNFALNFNWRTPDTLGYKCVAIGKTTAKELKKYCEPKISTFQSIDECVRLAKTLL